HFPAFPYPATRVVFDASVSVKDHGGACRGVIARPTRNARIVRIAILGEGDPGGRQPIAHLFSFGRPGSHDRVTHIVEGSGHISSVNRAELATEARTLPAPQIHICGSFPQRRLASGLGDSRAA